MITGIDSNSGIKYNFKVIDNIKFNWLEVYLKRIIHLIMKHLIKNSSAICKTSKCRLSNGSTKKVKDECKVDYSLISDENGVMICCDSCPRAFYCESIGLNINIIQHQAGVV